MDSDHMPFRPFSPVEQGAWSTFLAAHARLTRLIDEDLRRTAAISYVEFEVLQRLSWELDHRLRSDDLAARSHLLPQETERLVDGLMRAGLVKRVEAGTDGTDGNDGRETYVVLTEPGMVRLRVALASHVDLVRRHFLAYFSEDELRQLAGYFRRVLGSEDAREAHGVGDGAHEVP